LRYELIHEHISIAILLVEMSRGGLLLFSFYIKNTIFD
jgi:hypothetical protein